MASSERQRARGAMLYKYVATTEELKSLTPEQLDLRSQLEERINRYPVKQGYSRCFHSTNMEAALKIVATGLRPSELFNSQLGGRRNHNAGAFVTKLSPLEFGFPLHGWLGRLLNNNYGADVEGDQTKNDWVTKRGEVCLVLDLHNQSLTDAAEEDPKYKAEGRNVFYVPQWAFDMFDQQQLPPKLIVFAFRTTHDRKPTPEEANLLEQRLEESLERDVFEVEWLLRLTLEEKAAERRLKALWSERCGRAVRRLQPHWSKPAVQDIQQALISHSERLYLCGGDDRIVGDERRALDLLLEAIRPHSSLLKLGLSEMVLTNVGAALLAKVLEHNCTLRELSLDDNGVGCEGASKLGEALQRNATLQRLDLDHNEIGDQGAVALGKALQRNTTLQWLSLKENEIGDQGAVALGEALQQHSARLQELDLEDNKIGDEGAVSLGKALQHNATLQKLDLQDNMIGDQGAVSLGKALQHNATLQRLDLSKNMIGDQGTAALEALAGRVLFEDQESEDESEDSDSEDKSD